MHRSRRLGRDRTFVALARMLVSSGQPKRRSMQPLFLAMTLSAFACEPTHGNDDAGHHEDAGAHDAGPTANLLFRTGFGPGVTLTAPYGFWPEGALQALIGTDTETGFSFPAMGDQDSDLLNTYFVGQQLITYTTIDPSAISDHIVNEIREVPGPGGNPVHALFQNVRMRGAIGAGVNAQTPLLLSRRWDRGDVQDLYISYWFRYDDDLTTQLEYPVGNWRAQFEWKTGGHLDTWRGDYRIVTIVLKGPDDSLYWYTRGDNAGNIDWPYVEYWREENRTVPVPVREWFFYEVFWHHSGGADGRFWSAVNGQVIVDHRGPNMGDYGLPINRIMITNAYSGGYAPFGQHVTDVEIWDGFPCGAGASCYSAR